MICTTHMLLEVYMLIQVALIPVYIQEFQLSLLEASLIATIPDLIQYLTSVPIGLLADRYSAKHLLSGSMLVEGAAALLLSQTKSFWMLVFGVTVMKLSSPLYHITGLSQIGKLVKQGNMSRSIGVHNALGSLGVAVGAISLTFFMTTLGWRSTYLFWAIPILSWGFIMLRSSQLERDGTERREIEGKQGLARLSRLLGFSFIVLLAALGLREVGAAGISTFMTTYLVKVRALSESTSSLIFGLGPAVGILGALAGGYFGEKVGPMNGLKLSILGCATSLLTLWLTPQLYLLPLIYLTYAFFNHSVWTPMNTIVSNMSPRTERGLSFSVFFLTIGLVSSVAPPLAAIVMGASSISSIFPFSISFIVASLLMLQFISFSKRSLE